MAASGRASVPRSDADTARRPSSGSVAGIVAAARTSLAATEASSLPRTASEPLDHPTSPCADESPTRMSMSRTLAPEGTSDACARTVASGNAAYLNVPPSGPSSDSASRVPLSVKSPAAWPLTGVASIRPAWASASTSRPASSAPTCTEPAIVECAIRCGSAVPWTRPLTRAPAVPMPSVESCHARRFIVNLAAPSTGSVPGVPSASAAACAAAVISS